MALACFILILRGGESETNQICGTDKIIKMNGFSTLVDSPSDIDCLFATGSKMMPQSGF